MRWSASSIEDGQNRQRSRAFGCSARSVRRHQRRFEEGGLPALGRNRGYPKGHPRLPTSRLCQVTRLKGRGLSNCEIATLMGVTEKAVRNVLRRMGWTKPEQAEGALPLADESARPHVSAASIAGTATSARSASDPKLSAFPSSDPPPIPSLDRDPSDRRFDRIMACVGLLDDAAPLFRPGTAIAGAGVLLAMPALVASGVIECAREVYGSIGPAFFGLRTTIVALVLMALLRIKRPEALKEQSPDTLGRILGLDRAPEVKTGALHAVRPRAGRTPCRGTRGLDGVSLCRWTCTRLPRKGDTSQNPCGPDAPVHARHHGLLGQRRHRRTSFCCHR